MTKTYPPDHLDGLRAVRELRLLIDGIADVDWSHPGWWLLLGGTALMESCARPGAGLRLRRRGRGGQADGGAPPDDSYVNSNGTARTDTFMGRWRPLVPAGHAVRLAERVADAVIRARAAVDARLALDGRLLAQPLSCYLSRTQPLCRRVPLDRAASRIAFVTPRGVVAADVAADPRDDVRLAASLARYCVSGITDARLWPVDLSAAEPVAAAAAVSLLLDLPATARHLHRRAWSRGGGPWLGVGETPDMDVVTTCHMVVDGYGHTLLTRDIFDRVDRRAADRRALVAAAGERDVTPGWSTLAAPQRPVADALPLGIATAVLPGVAPSFARFAYALGIALERYYGHVAVRRSARFSPAFQVPVLPGAPGDPERWRRRTIPGLMSVRRTADGFEPLDEFRRRVPEVLARAAASRGLLGRMRQAVIGAPVPTMWKRRLLASRPRQFMPVLEVLSGRGCMSSLRFPDADRPGEPLVAVSSPGLYPTSGHPGGSTILTTMDTAAGLAVTVTGTGFAGTERGAQAFLDLWVEELEAAGGKARAPGYEDAAVAEARLIAEP